MRLIKGGKFTPADKMPANLGDESGWTVIKE